MNSTNAKDYLPLVQAFAEGKTIQIQTIGDMWVDIVGTVHFGSDPSQYRIKPEPREVWVTFSPDGEPIATHIQKPEWLPRDSRGQIATVSRYREVIE